MLCPLVASAMWSEGIKRLIETSQSKDKKIKFLNLKSQALRWVWLYLSVIHSHMPAKTVPLFSHFPKTGKGFRIPDSGCGCQASNHRISHLPSFRSSPEMRPIDLPLRLGGRLGHILSQCHQDPYPKSDLTRTRHGSNGITEEEIHHACGEDAIFYLKCQIWEESNLHRCLSVLVRDGRRSANQSHRRKGQKKDSKRLLSTTFSSRRTKQF